MAEEIVIQEELEDKLNEAYNMVQENQQELPERIYKAIEGISNILLAWMQLDGAPGWTQYLLNPDQSSFFTKDQSAMVEQLATTFEPQLRYLTGKNTSYNIPNRIQVGGDLPSITSSQLPNKVSLDSIFFGIMNQIGAYDEQFRQLSKSLGVLSDENLTGDIQRSYEQALQPTQFALVPRFFPATAVFALVYTILDFIRLGVGSPAYDVKAARIFLSIVISILDFLRGNWKNAVLTLLGVGSPNGVVMGLFGKFVNNAWMLITPNLRDKLIFTVYQSTKGLFIGFLMTSFAIFAPIDIRDKTQEQYNQLKEFINNAASDKSQNYFCTDKYTSLFNSFQTNSILRLVGELINIPTTKEARNITCQGVEGYKPQTGGKGGRTRRRKVLRLD
jgi:hypothetical protein